MTDQPIGQDNLEGAQGQQVDNSAPADTGTPNINPAWNDLLGVVPSQLHSQVTPHLQKWDQNYESQIQKVHSQYEPWKPIIDNGATPDDVGFALSLMEAISNEPQQVITALQEWVQQLDNGEVVEQQGQNGSNPQSPNDPYDLSNNPAYKQMESAVQSMAQILLDQKTQEQQAQEDAALEQELSDLKEKYKDRGEFDENYVFGIALNDPDMSLEQAVEKFFEIQDKILQNARQPGPPVLGSGGAFPNTNLDTRKLGSSDTKALVANLLQQAQQNT
jgi:hypothetical protein